jgi:hypothetical protein
MIMIFHFIQGLKEVVLCLPEGMGRVCPSMNRYRIDIGEAVKSRLKLFNAGRQVWAKALHCYPSEDNENLSKMLQTRIELQ